MFISKRSRRKPAAIGLAQRIPVVLYHEKKFIRNKNEKKFKKEKSRCRRREARCLLKIYYYYLFFIFF